MLSRPRFGGGGRVDEVDATTRRRSDGIGSKNKRARTRNNPRSTPTHGYYTVLQSAFLSLSLILRSNQPGRKGTRGNMLYSSTVLARNASSILAHISRLPVELASHPLLFTLSTNAPASSLSPLVSALSALSSSGSVGCLSAPLTHPATATIATTTPTTAAPIACSLAFFRKDHAVPFRSEIPGRPEIQVGRWHAMRRKGEKDEESQGGEVGLTAEEKDVDWETIWNRSLKGSEVPPALRGLRCVRLPLSLARPVFNPNMAIVLFIPENKTFIPSSLSQTTPPRVSTSHFPPSH